MTLYWKRQTMPDKKCQCKFCQEDYPMLKRLRDKLDKEEFDWVENIFESLSTIETDMSVLRDKIRGVWPEATGIHHDGLWLLQLKEIENLILVHIKTGDCGLYWEANGEHIIVEDQNIEKAYYLCYGVE